MPRTRAARVWQDRIGRHVVTAGGLGIIAAILGIFAFLVLEVVPLLLPASVAPVRAVTVAGLDARAVLVDEHQTFAAVLDGMGRIRVVRLADGTVVQERPLLTREGVRPTGVGQDLAGRVLAIATSDGRVVGATVEWRVTFDASVRRTTAVVSEPIEVEVDESRAPVGIFSVRKSAEGVLDVAAVTASGSVAFVQTLVEENALSGERTMQRSRRTLEIPAAVGQLLLDHERRNLYAGTSDGSLAWWRLEHESPRPQLYPGPRPVTMLGLAFGDRSLVVGREDGALECWMQVRSAPDSAEFDLRRIRVFPSLGGAPRGFAPSLRNKGFVVLGAGRELGIYYVTTGQRDWSGTTALASPAALTYTPKGDALLVAGADALELRAIEHHHPETSLGTLFGAVWYEGAEAPSYTWQSTSGTDDFEPKLGLIPLLSGTLKATLYCLLLAVPLAVLAAMYVSQFMHPDLRRWVKPTIELMAALPSVVLGFLAAMWLAPQVERHFSALILAPFLIPALVLGSGFLGIRLVPRAVRNRFRAGSEAFTFALVVVAGGWICLQLGPVLERMAFAGDFPVWVRSTFGVVYDQRNTVVIALAMSLAVIPIIFSIAEEAFTNVPRNLVSGSLALGATRWQTVTRVVLPTASPGIFSAIMVGFGRAVGETMIVLMATGNTAILSWSPFNGLRTLSANIAVEIPEAPHGSTLYRVLFLSGLILFVFTFLVNTVAELIRQRLRTRYATL
ncbi:MAG: ABC transporter permease subunit [Planctomycetes bacterium]|nr:ABC transporter permease subunit [Planctomycetota bacterium]